MFFATLITCFIGLFWITNRNRSRREIVNIVSFVGVFSVWSIFVVLPDNFSSSMLFLLALPFFIFYLFYFQMQLAPASLEIQATQENYWDLITPQKVVNFFLPRRQIKKKRIDVEINPLSKHWYRKYGNEGIFLNGNFFLEYENLILTKIKKIEFFSEYPLYFMIFQRLKKIIDDKELSPDLDEILERNKHYAEFFLMELWETYTQDINIGVANLIVMAKRRIEEQLIGALDNLDLNSVKRNGAALFYFYMDFKEKVPISERLELEEDEYF